MQIKKKVAKRRFRILDEFRYDGAIWRVLYMYLLSDDLGVWYHLIEEVREREGDRALQAWMDTNAYAQHEKIEYTPFKNHDEASKVWTYIYANGDRAIKTTQELLKLTKL